MAPRCHVQVTVGSAQRPADTDSAQTRNDNKSEPRCHPTVGGLMSIPASLQKVVTKFERAPKDLRVQALLHYAKKIPPLPAELLVDRSELEQVHECQTPFFLASRVDPGGSVHLFFDAPPESPTVRGFAGILYAGLEGCSARDVLAVPPDFYSRMGLAEVVSPLRLRGMSAILGRLQRQVREATSARQDADPSNAHDIE